MPANEVIVEKPVHSEIPALLLEPCEKASIPVIATERTVKNFMMNQEQAIDRCNIKLQKIKERDYETKKLIEGTK